MGGRLAHGLSVLTVGDGPPLVSIPGLGQGGGPRAGGPPQRCPLGSRARHGDRAPVHLINRPLEMPPCSTIADVAGWYADVLRNRFDGPVDVFGASAGGVTALQLAFRRASSSWFCPSLVTAFLRVNRPHTVSQEACVREN